MYGLGRFNLARFNLIQDPATEIFLKAHMSLIMRAQAMRGGDYYARAQMPAMLECEAEGAPTWHGRMAASIAAHIAAKLAADAPGGAHMLETARSLVWLSLNRHQSAHGENPLLCNITISANILRAAEMSVAALSWVYPAKDARAYSVRHRMQMDGEVSPTRFLIQNARFDITIPPGGTLVIDSGGYVVLLDGQSVIHTHEGDWLHLTRATHDVVFEATEGALSVDKSILYTERWL